MFLLNILIISILIILFVLNFKNKKLKIIADGFMEETVLNIGLKICMEKNISFIIQ